MPSSGGVTTASMLSLKYGRRCQEQESRKGHCAPHVYIISLIRGGDATKINTEVSAFLALAWALMVL